MKTRFKGLLPLLLLLLLTMPVVGQAQDFTYTTNNGAITITKYTDPGGDVTIPSTINGLPVTSIGDSAFYGVAALPASRSPTALPASETKSSSPTGS